MAEKFRAINVHVETEDSDTNRVTTHIIDFSVKDNRDWFIRHIVWALNNGQAVTAYETDQVPNHGVVRATGAK